MSTLTAWFLVNNLREVDYLPSVLISTAGTCIAKLKPLVENMKNKTQVSSDINAPAFKAIFLWCLQFSLQVNIITLRDARNIPVEKEIIGTK